MRGLFYHIETFRPVRATQHDYVWVRCSTLIKTFGNNWEPVGLEGTNLSWRALVYRRGQIVSRRLVSLHDVLNIWLATGHYVGLTNEK